MSSLRQVIKQNEVFADLDDKVLDEFIDSAVERHFKKGEILTAELVHGDEIYFILEGEISIGIALAGSDAPIEQLSEKEGQLVGLVHFIEESVSHATEVAVTDVKVLAWKGSKWREISERHPRSGYHIAVSVAKMLTRRMHYFNMHMLDSMSWGLD